MKKSTFIKTVSLASLTLVMFACKNSHIYKGDRYYENIAYANAIPHYEKVYYKHPSRDIGIRLADSYYRTGNFEAAEAVYKVVIDEQTKVDIQYFNYGKVLMANGKYDDAKKVFKEYIAIKGGDPVAQMLLSSCNSLNERYMDTTLYSVEEIETEGFSNTFSVTEYRDGIVFVADREVYSGRKQNPWTGTSYLDLYHMGQSEDGTWLSPQLLSGDINGPFHEGPATFNSNGTEVYFTRSNYFKRKLEVNEEMENNLKIFKASLIDGKWKNLEEFPYNSDDYSVGHPALTPCCYTMYFVSDMPGGFGGTDIYRCDLVEGQWTTPENLGSDVNSPGNEMFPYVSEDGALYFSSDAHNSMGGLDVFITYFTGERWVEPENLNYPINSDKDDFGFIIDDINKTGFVSSSRSEKDKIYKFEKHDPTFNLYGFAHKKGSEIPVEGVRVEITNRGTKEVLSAISDKEGKFKMKLGIESTYDLYCTKLGCFARSDELTTAGLKYSHDFYADFEVEEIVIDKPIVLKDIFYDFDMWNIRPDAAKELDRLVKILEDNPNIEIEMGSHTDTRGSDAYNLILSGKRAYAAAQYLVYRGIDAKRLTWRGYGETVLVNECKNDVPCSEEQHQENRRTEFKVTKINE